MAEFKPTFDWLKQRPLCLLAFGFGSGLAPVAPGTFGTMAALPIAFLLVLIGIDGWILAFLCVALFMWGIRICNHTEKALGIQAYGGIFWDEMVAMLRILALAPFKWNWSLAAFILFRLSDSIKPWPIKRFDRHVHGVFCIMLDDIIATIITFIGLGLAVWII